MAVEKRRGAGVVKRVVGERVVVGRPVGGQEAQVRVLFSQRLHTHTHMRTYTHTLLIRTRTIFTHSHTHTLYSYTHACTPYSHTLRQSYCTPIRGHIISS